MPVDSQHEGVIVDARCRAGGTATIVGVLAHDIGVRRIAVWHVWCAAPALSGVGRARVAVFVGPIWNVLAAVCEGAPVSNEAHSLYIHGDAIYA